MTLERSRETEKKMSPNRFPPRWDQERVDRLLSPYESLTEEEQVAEDEAALECEEQTVISIPTHLLPAVRKILKNRPTKN
jgi:hypothetical protein